MVPRNRFGGHVGATWRIRLNVQLHSKTVKKIYVNDVLEEFPDSCICKLYADDVKLYSVMRTVNDYKTLQKSLDTLDNWSHAWQLPISYKKCSFMIISNLKNEQDLSLSLHLGNNAISQQETTKDLGIHTDSNLKFSSHISHLVAKAHARASVIHKCFLSKDRNTLVKLMCDHCYNMLFVCGHLISLKTLLKLNLCNGTLQSDFTVYLASAVVTG